MVTSNPDVMLPLDTPVTGGVSDTDALYERVAAEFAAPLARQARAHVS